MKAFVKGMMIDDTTDPVKHAISYYQTNLIPPSGLHSVFE